MSDSDKVHHRTLRRLIEKFIWMKFDLDTAIKNRINGRSIVSPRCGANCSCQLCLKVHYCFLLCSGNAKDKKVSEI